MDSVVSDDPQNAVPCPPDVIHPPMISRMQSFEFILSRLFKDRVNCGDGIAALIGE
jgi:hypothetical protein